MTNMQRMRSDTATMDRRDTADKTIVANRNKNDELTGDRRFRADRTMQENRLRNDQMTANRREIKDGNSGMTLTLFLVVLIVLAVGAYLVFI